MATYYFRNVGINWGDATNWSLTDGGGATGAVPGISDTARFTVNSGNCTVNVASNCLTLDTTGFTNTLTISNTLTVSGTAITIGGSSIIVGGSYIRISGTPTITSNGVSLGIGIYFLPTSTGATLTDNITAFGIESAGSSAVINGNTLNLIGGLSNNYILRCTSGGDIFGTTEIVLLGDGIVDIQGPGGSILNNNLTINSSGTITITSLRKNGGTLTYTTGTITGLRELTVANTTLDCDGMIFGNVRPITGGTNGANTLISDFWCENILNSGASSWTFNGASYKIYTKDITLTGASVNRPIQGTSTIELNSSGTISSSGTGLLSLNTIINHSGTTTLSGILRVPSITLTRTSGTISGSISIIGSPTLDLNSAPINDLTISSAAATVTLNSDINILTSLVNSTSTAASKALIKSNSTGIQRKLTLNPAATMDIGFTNFTDIDASSGRKIWVWKPTLSNTNNIYSVSYTSFRQSTNVNIT